MAHANSIVPFGLAVGSNVLSPAAYAALPQRQSGFASGLANSAQMNTALRQASFIATMVAQFTADYGIADVLDDANLAALEANFVAALIKAVKPRLTATFYVNAATGNDANDGSAGTPFATIQGAINAINANYVSIGNVTINVANGSYAGFAVTPSGVGAWKIIGNIATPTACTVAATSTAVNLGRGITSYGTSLNVSGFSITSYYENAAATSAGLLFIDSCAFHAPTGGNTAVGSYTGATVRISGACSYTGNASSFCASAGGNVQFGYYDLAISVSFTLTLIGTPNFTNGFAQSGAAGSINSFLPVVSFIGAATGRKFYIYQNGVINTGGGGPNYFPGNAAGYIGVADAYS